MEGPRPTHAYLKPPEMPLTLKDLGGWRKRQPVEIFFLGRTPTAMESLYVIWGPPGGVST